MYSLKIRSFIEHSVYSFISMPSSNSCRATNQPTAIVSELNNTKNQIINANGIKNSITKIPAHKFYGDSTTPMKLVIKQSKLEQNGDVEHVIRKQSDHSSSLMTVGTARKMNRLPDIRIGDEVLVEIDSEKLYLGIVNDTKNDLFLTQFANGTEQWSPIRKLTKLNVNEESSMCVVCKEFNEIVQVCSQCRRGFHQKCIKISTNDDGTSVSTLSSTSSLMGWHCHKCSNTPKLNEQSNQVEKFNKTPSGCYCGEQGDWFMQMLQCARCLQWFHAKCIKCLNFPLYFGDRYVKCLFLSSFFFQKKFFFSFLILLCYALHFNLRVRKI